MSVYAGFDLSTLAIDVVLLDEDTDGARHIRRRLDTGPGDAKVRIRRIRDAMPPRASWADLGVIAAAIEEPFSRASMGGQVPILMALGGVLQTIPVNLPVALLRADDWRKECGLPIRGPREKLKAASVDFAATHWANRPQALDDNQADAFGLAWAARCLHQKSLQTAAA